MPPADSARPALASFGARFALPILVLGALSIGFSGIFIAHRAGRR